ncbi:hypothetical protein HMPREF0971_00023 [Segatella oris F0302]|uniref:Uncharacterized protein n=1 Tax=Segatella oris F0302 TaxID=649760 RepID=D1QM41_9BACT|nr:hypothetical protein HMPREF0971_00023 [Segatella oris F0302]
MTDSLDYGNYNCIVLDISRKTIERQLSLYRIVLNIICKQVTCRLQKFLFLNGDNFEVRSLS